MKIGTTTYFLIYSQFLKLHQNADGEPQLQELLRANGDLCGLRLAKPGAQKKESFTTLAMKMK
jgi:hypothetical protein